MLKVYTRKQQIIARSSTEAEIVCSSAWSVRRQRDGVIVARLGSCNDPNA